MSNLHRFPVLSVANMAECLGEIGIPIPVDALREPTGASSSTICLKKSSHIQLEI